MNTDLRFIDLTDDAISFEGAVSLEYGDGWIQPWRLPCDQLDLFPPETLRDRAAGPAGVRLSFRSNTRTIRLSIEPFAEAGKIDCVCD